MRTDITVEIDGNRIRGVINALSWDAMIGALDFHEFQRAVATCDPRTTRRILTAAIGAAGDLPPLKIAPEVDRLMEELPLREVGFFALRLIEDALDKTERASKNSLAAEAETTAAAAEPEASSTL